MDDCDCYCDLCEAGDEAECSCMNDHKVFPVLNPCCAFILMMLNIFPLTSGFGTIFSACCCGDAIKPCKILMIGLLQFLMTLIIIGWIWSIIHGL